MNSGDSQITSRHHNLRIVFDRIHELYEQISSLPCGYVSRKTIKGKTRHYRQWRDKDGKVKGVYIKEPDDKAVVAGIERRRRLEGELAELEAYVQQSLRINTPEVRTFLIRYDRGRPAGSASSQTKAANQSTVFPLSNPQTNPQRLPPHGKSCWALPSASWPKAFWPQTRLPRQRGSAPTKFKNWNPSRRTARPSPPCQRNPPAWRPPRGPAAPPRRWAPSTTPQPPRPDAGPWRTRPALTRPVVVSSVPSGEIPFNRQWPANSSKVSWRPMSSKHPEHLTAAEQCRAVHAARRVVLHRGAVHGGHGRENLVDREWHGSLRAPAGGHPRSTSASLLPPAPLAWGLGPVVAQLVGVAG